MNTFRYLFAILFSIACGCEGDDTSALPPPNGDTGRTRIADVQGANTTSPFDGQSVTIRGVVTGDFQDKDSDPSGNLGGFFVQSERPDDDPATSEGLFVFDSANPTTDVNVGDVVVVTGSVKEHFGETQITASGVDVTGRSSVQATEIRLPSAAVTMNSDRDPIANLERFEGMLVRFPQTLTISELFNLERFGAIRLSQGGRLFQFTNGNIPSPSDYGEHKTMIASRSIELDDGQRKSNAAPIRYLNADATPNAAIRVGDTVTDLTGNLRYSRGSGASGDETWRIMPTRQPAFVSANPRPAAPAVGGSLRIASFNVLNYFSTVDNGRRNCGPASNDGCRGADSNREQLRQLSKIVTAIALIDADIVGLIELENNATDSLSDIVAALNVDVGARTYASLDTGAVGDDVIKTGFIYKPGTVALAGKSKILDERIDPRFNTDRNRPALAQTFAQTATGERLTIVVNHFKSKGSNCNDDDDPNAGDGQGNCNRIRTSAAKALADWLETDPTGSEDSDVLIIGDLNAYRQEVPIKALEQSGYTSLIDGSETYSFVFDGQSGALDHALVTRSLVRQVVDAIQWHINADEAPVRDYNLEHDRDANIFDGETPYRASDHDPLVIGLDLQ